MDEEIRCERIDDGLVWIVVGGSTDYKEWVTSNFSPQRTDFGDSTIVVTRIPLRSGRRGRKRLKEGTDRREGMTVMDEGAMDGGKEGGEARSKKGEVRRLGRDAVPFRLRLRDRDLSAITQFLHGLGPLLLNCLHVQLFRIN